MSMHASRNRFIAAVATDAAAPPDPPTPVPLAMVGPDGTVSLASPALEFPNGMTLINGDRTLVVAETRAVPPRLTAFDVAANGTLSRRRVLAEFGAEMPDGICAAATWLPDEALAERTGQILTVAADVPARGAV
jgi:sugar lactone lactonase YvrE